MGYVRNQGGMWYGYYRNREGKYKSTQIPRHHDHEARDDAEDFERRSRLAITDFNPAWTLGQYIEWWLARERGFGVMQPQSITALGSKFNTHVLAYEIAQKQVMPLTQDDIKSWFLDVKERNAGNPTAQLSARDTMSRIIKAAITSEHCLGMRGGFPIDAQELGVRKIQPEDQRTFTPAEYRKLMAVPKPQAHDLLLRLHLNTGTRPGEMYALRPRHFDWERKTVRIRETAIWLATKADGDDEDRLVIRPETKTYRARTISVDEEIMADIRLFIHEQEIGSKEILFSRKLMGIPVWGANRVETIELTPEVLATLGSYTLGNMNMKHGTLYSYNHGKCRCEYCHAASLADQRRRNEAKRKRPTIIRPLDQDVIPKGKWCDLLRGYVAEAGIDWPEVEPYDCRHTHATWLAENGINVRELQKRMGHKSLDMTQRYIQDTEIKRDAVDLLKIITAPVPQAPAQPSTDLTSLLAGVSATELFALLQTKMAQEQKMAQSG